MLLGKPLTGDTFLSKRGLQAWSIRSKLSVAEGSYLRFSLCDPLMGAPGTRLNFVGRDANGFYGSARKSTMAAIVHRTKSQSKDGSQITRDYCGIKFARYDHPSSRKTWKWQWGPARKEPPSQAEVQDKYDQIKKRIASFPTRHAILGEYTSGQLVSEVHGQYVPLKLPTKLSQQQRDFFRQLIDNGIDDARGSLPNLPELPEIIANCNNDLALVLYQLDDKSAATVFAAWKMNGIYTQLNLLCTPGFIPSTITANQLNKKLQRAYAAIDAAIGVTNCSASDFHGTVYRVLQRTSTVFRQKNITQKSQVSGLFRVKKAQKKSSGAATKSGDDGDGDPDPDPDRPQFYDYAALAALLSCGVQHVRNLRCAGKLPPAIKLPYARGPRWTVDAVDAWLASNAEPYHPTPVARSAPKSPLPRKIGRPRIADQQRGGRS